VPAVTARLLVIACGLFFLSGAAGLAYEVIWFKRFVHVWGSSALAAGSVLASFLLGLGAGAAVLGRLADRSRRPLLWYGFAELGIGLLALLVIPGIVALQWIAAAAYPLLEGNPVSGSLFRCFLTLLVLGPPCFLMGGTFPLLVRQLTPPGGTLRDSTGILYAVNTLGGAAGAYLASFHLLPALGLHWTNLLAVAANLTAGGAALLALWFLRSAPGEAAADAAAALFTAAPPPPARGSSAPLPRGPAAPRRFLLLAALFSGAGSLALQIAWTRQLSLVLGGSTYAFGAMLLVILAGIGLGSLLFHLWLKTAYEPLRLQAVVVLVLLSSVVLGQRLIEPLTWLLAAAKDLRGDPAWNGGLSFLAASGLELIPSICMGILLPLYAAASGKGAGEAGSTSGDLYAWNTAGCLLGALGGALFVLPLLGVQAAVAGGLGLYLAGAVLLLPSRGLRSRSALVALATTGGGLVVLSSFGQDPLVTNLGLYLYGGSPATTRNEIRQLFFEEGVTVNVLVGQQGDTISLRVNGKVDASDNRDMPTQLGLAYFPRLLHLEAREVLVIGFGSGTTSGASLLFPGTEVTCAEIEPAVVRASPSFFKVNHQPLESRHFHLVLNDGRNHLQGTRARYDLILSEPSNPWMAGVSNLFTREFYQAARAHLTPGGILGQWIQTYSLNPSDFALVARTISQVFPHGMLLRLGGSDTLLLASERPLEAGRESLDRAQEAVDRLPRVRLDLEKHFGTAEVRSLLLSHLALGDEGLRKLIAAGGSNTLNTDLNLRLEFDAPLRLFDPASNPLLVRKSILQAADTGAARALWERWGCGPAQLPALREAVDLFAQSEVWGPARALIDLGLAVEPREPYFLAARFMSAMPEGEKEWEEGFSRIMEVSPEEAARVGVWLYLMRDLDRAIKVWNRLIKTHPHAAALWVNLSASYEARNDRDEAGRALGNARQIDPFSDLVKSRLEPGPAGK
jgi:spermidine synthase